MVDRLSQVLGVYDEFENLIAVVIKNGSKHPVIYSVEAMDLDSVYSLLKGLNISQRIIKTKDTQDA